MSKAFIEAHLPESISSDRLVDLAEVLHDGCAVIDDLTAEDPESMELLLADRRGQRVTITIEDGDDDSVYSAFCDIVERLEPLEARFRGFAQGCIERSRGITVPPMIAWSDGTPESKTLRLKFGEDLEWFDSKSLRGAGVSDADAQVIMDRLDGSPASGLSP